MSREPETQTAETEVVTEVESTFWSMKTMLTAAGSAAIGILIGAAAVRFGGGTLSSEVPTADMPTA